MADNTRLNVGVNGDLIASDDIGGVKHQLIKMEFGDDGTATQVSATNPLPVSSGGLTDAQIRATALPVSGTFYPATQLISAASLPLPTGAAIAANQQTNALTDAQLRASAIQVTAATISPTYSAVTEGISAAISATDLISIYGSATKTINILRISMSGVQTTASQVLFVLIRRSTTNTGGTPTSQIMIPFDSNDAASTATFVAYGANPSALGTSVGNVRRDRVFMPGIGSATYAAGLNWEFTDAKPLILRGTSQGVCINLNGQTVAGGLFNVMIEWTES